MVVVPVKWLPYLLIFTGVYGLVSGDQEFSTGTSLFFIVIGAIWLYLKHGARPAASPAKSTVGIAAPVAPSSGEVGTDSPKTPAPSSDSTRYCPCCGAACADPNSVYCSSCGTKL